jgi:hypothetical protein
MHTEASVAALELGFRIGRGAKTENGEFFYDSALNMVRTKRTSAPPPEAPHPVQEELDFESRKEPASAGNTAIGDLEVGS